MLWFSVVSSKPTTIDFVLVVGLLYLTGTLGDFLKGGTYGLFVCCGVLKVGTSGCLTNC